MFFSCNLLSVFSFSHDSFAGFSVSGEADCVTSLGVGATVSSSSPSSSSPPSYSPELADTTSVSVGTGNPLSSMFSLLLSPLLKCFAGGDSGTDGCLLRVGELFTDSGGGDNEGGGITGLSARFFALGDSGVSCGIFKASTVALPLPRLDNGKFLTSRVSSLPLHCIVSSSAFFSFACKYLVCLLVTLSKISSTLHCFFAGLGGLAAESNLGGVFLVSTDVSFAHSFSFTLLSFSFTFSFSFSRSRCVSRSFSFSFSLRDSRVLFLLLTSSFSSSISVFSECFRFLKGVITDSDISVLGGLILLLDIVIICAGFGGVDGVFFAELAVREFLGVDVTFLVSAPASFRLSALSALRVSLTDVFGSLNSFVALTSFVSLIFFSSLVAYL